MEPGGRGRGTVERREEIVLGIPRDGKGNEKDGKAEGNGKQQRPRARMALGLTGKMPVLRAARQRRRHGDGGFVRVCQGLSGFYKVWNWRSKWVSNFA